MIRAALERWLRIPKRAWILWALACVLWLSVPWRMIVWLQTASEQNPAGFDFPLMGPALGTPILVLFGFPFLLLLLRKCMQPYAAGASLLAWDHRGFGASLTVTILFGALIAWQSVWAIEHGKVGLWGFLIFDATWIYLWASLRAGLIAQSYPKFQVS